MEKQMIQNKIQKITGAILLLIFISTFAFAQDKVVDQIVAIVGGSKFHSLDCKMVENKAKKRLKYYISAHEAQNDGLKPCKLCKAVSFLHQI